MRWPDIEFVRREQQDACLSRSFLPDEARQALQFPPLPHDSLRRGHLAVRARNKAGEFYRGTGEAVGPPKPGFAGFAGAPITLKDRKDRLTLFCSDTMGASPVQYSLWCHFFRQIIRR
jgi:hypothetical protein